MKGANMRIKFEYCNKLKEINIGNVSIFYGYSNSGKSRLSKILLDGFTQKNKTQFMIDGFQTFKNQFEVIYISGKENIEEHIKMNAKSILKKLYFQNIMDIVNNNDEFSNYVSEKFADTNEQVLSLCQNIYLTNEKLGIKLTLDSIDDLITSCIRITFTNEEISSSNSKMLLYNALNEYNQITPQKKIIIADDFDIFLDEQYTKQLLQKMIDDQNNYYFLFTNKAESLPYVIDKGNIFNIRDSNIIDLSNIKRIIKYILGSINEKHTFEEYLINEGLLVLNDEVEEVIHQITNHGIINFGRILVNEKYSIDIDKEEVTIYPTNQGERKFLLYIDEIIKSSSDTTR